MLGASGVAGVRGSEVCGGMGGACYMSRTFGDIVGRASKSGEGGQWAANRSARCKVGCGTRVPYTPE